MIIIYLFLLNYKLDSFYSFNKITYKYDEYSPISNSTVSNYYEGYEFKILNLIIKILDITIHGYNSGWIYLGGTPFTLYRSIGYYHSRNNEELVPILGKGDESLADLNKIHVYNRPSSHINHCTFIFIGL